MPPKEEGTLPQNGLQTRDCNINSSVGLQPTCSVDFRPPNCPHCMSQSLKLREREREMLLVPFLWRTLTDTQSIGMAPCHHTSHITLGTSSANLSFTGVRLYGPASEAVMLLWAALSSSPTYFYHSTEILHQEHMFTEDVLLNEAALLGTRVLMLNTWVPPTYRLASKSAHHWREERKMKKQPLPVVCN